MTAGQPGMESTATLARRLLQRAFRAMGGRCLLFVVLATVHSVLQGWSLLLLLPLLGSLGIGNAQDSAIAAWLRGTLAAFGVHYSLAAILTFLFAVALATATIGLVNGWIAHSMYRRLVGDLQIEAYATVLNSKIALLSRQRTGDSSTVLTRFVEQSGNAFFILARLLPTCLMMIAVAAVALSQAFWLVLTIFAVLSLGVWPTRRYAKVVHEMVGRSHTLSRQLGADLTEHLQLSSLIKSFGAEVQSLIIATRRIRLTQSLLTKLRRRIDTVRTAWEVGAFAFLCITIYLAAEVFKLSVDRLLILIGAFMRIVPAIQGIVTRAEQLPVLLGNFDGVCKLMTTCTAMGERRGGLPAPAGPLVSGVELCDVHVADGETPILRGASLVIPPKSVVGVTGRSGAGKTTIVNTILGLTELVRGSVRIDGVDLAKIDLQAWRRRTGYVSQNAPIFHATVRENLLFAAPEADDQAMYGALDLAGVGEFVRALPKGLETTVGEHGGLISGGERQRIVIARALLRDPLLLILDEPTNALDSATVQTVMASIEHLRTRMPILVIAHDLEVVRSADVICVMDQGRVIEQGTWADLMDQGGHFSQLAVLQRQA